MNEYDLCIRILSPHLQPANQNLLLEKKTKKPHKAYVVGTGVEHWTLYRYDQDEDPTRFFPFFNNTRGDNGSPVDLLKFCDYIVLVSKKNNLYVLLVEMKSGKAGDANKQLEASKTFIHFILETAERIAPANNYGNVNARNVCIRKILLKPQQKPGTNIAKSKNSRIDLNADIITLPSLTLPLNKLTK